MITAIIITSILIVFIIGFIQVYKRHSNVIKKVDFASEYRNKFIEFANKYFDENYQWNHEKKIDSELYVWLTMNVTKIQGSLGNLGVMDYMAPFQAYKVSNYQIILPLLVLHTDKTLHSFTYALCTPLFGVFTNNTCTQFRPPLVQASRLYHHS